MPSAPQIFVSDVDHNTFSIPDDQATNVATTDPVTPSYEAQQIKLFASCSIVPGADTSDGVASIVRVSDGTVLTTIAATAFFHGALSCIALSGVDNRGDIAGETYALQLTCTGATAVSFVRNAYVEARAD